MNILALDLGTRTGWASNNSTEYFVGSRGPRLHDCTSGVQEFKLERGESAGMRYLRFRRWIEDMAGLVKPGLIAYEQAFMMPTALTSEIFFGFITSVQVVCAARGIEHMSVNAMKLKTWATGGVKKLGHRANKQDMINAVCDRWKPGVTDDNEADAIALLHYVLSQLPQETP